MKKIAILFLVLLGGVLSGFAQPRIGVRAGYNMSNVLKLVDLEGDEDEKLDWKSAANFGVTVDLRKSERFVFRPGLYFSMKGYKDNDYSYLPIANLNYLEMPLLAVFQFPVTDKLKIELQTGLYFAYGVCGKYKLEVGTYMVTDENVNTYAKTEYKKFPSFEETLLFKRFDWGGNLGLGISYDHYYLGAAYELGAVVFMHSSNHCFSVNLGYNF
jgi:hypothetical protein